jgi:hypothetical protein
MKIHEKNNLIYINIQVDDENLFGDDDMEIPLTQIPSSQMPPPAKRPKLMPLTFSKVKETELGGILSVQAMKEMNIKLRRKAAAELTLLKTTKFPHVSLGGNKTFAASYSLETGKSHFHFENVQNDDHIEIDLTEHGLDVFMVHAKDFIDFAKKMEELKQTGSHNAENRSEPAVPEPVTLEIIEKEGQKYERSLSAFKFTNGSGCCISLKETNLTNKKEYKQWLLSGTSFVTFVLIHIPFFSDFYEKFSNFIGSIRDSEGLGVYNASEVGSWKKKITNAFGF